MFVSLVRADDDVCNQPAEIISIFNSTEHKGSRSSAARLGKASIRGMTDTEDQMLKHTSAYVHVMIWQSFRGTETTR